MDVHGEHYKFRNLAPSPLHSEKWTDEMKPDKAIKLAIQCIRKEIQRIAFDANIGEIMGEAAYPGAKKALAKREELKEVVIFLEQAKGKI